MFIKKIYKNEYKDDNNELKMSFIILTKMI